MDISICIYTYIYVCLFVCVFTYLLISMQLHEFTYVYTFINSLLHLLTYLIIHLYVVHVHGRSAEAIGMSSNSVPRNFSDTLASHICWLPAPRSSRMASSSKLKYCTSKPGPLNGGALRRGRYHGTGRVPCGRGTKH